MWINIIHINSVSIHVVSVYSRGLHAWITVVGVDSYGPRGLIKVFFVD